jgi:hypothetical protein
MAPAAESGAHLVCELWEILQKLEDVRELDARVAGCKIS